MIPHIGLEIHIRLQTKSKLFCSCPSLFGQEANRNVCPVCLGYPGTLPVLNSHAVWLGCLVAQSLQCEIAPCVLFERKNYFYPDLPKNYQISQYALPLGKGGHFVTWNQDVVHIREVHLEEDAGKMIHASDKTYCDYNRAGTPLLEIVTQPDLHSAKAVEYMLQEFRRTVQYLNVCDGNMEEGSLRCDVNISVGSQESLGTKVEIKNLNSFRFVRMALQYEIKRQIALLKEDKLVQQETRQWNEHRDRTELMRSKEDVHDYRYFPEPDLTAYPLKNVFLKTVSKALVELPNERAKRFIHQYKLSDSVAWAITEKKEIADFFEQTVQEGADPLKLVSWLEGEVKKVLNKTGSKLSSSPLTPSRMQKLLWLLETSVIQRKIAQRVLSCIISEDKDPSEIIEEYNWERISDIVYIQKLVENVINAHESVVCDFLEGKEKVVDYLLGKVMEESAGRIDPQLAIQSLRDLLNKKKENR